MATATKKLIPSRLSDQLVEILRAEILRQYQAGDRFESIRQLAQRFSTSTVTVRQALTTLTTEGLIEQRHGSGTYVADRSRDQHVAVLVHMDLTHPRISPFWLRICQGLRQSLEAEGFTARVYMGHDVDRQDYQYQSPEFMQSIAQDKVCGVAAVAWPLQMEWIEPLRERAVPIIGTVDDCSPAVMVDFEKLVREGTRRLVQTGRRNIAFMDRVPREGEGTPRVKWFKAALQEFGGTTRDNWIAGDLHPNLPGAGWEEFREIWLSSSEKPDGLLVCDDMLFQGAVPAIVELGFRVPERLMVVSHANKGAQEYCPFPVSFMEIDPLDCAQAMSAMLVRLIHGQSVEQPLVKIGFRWVEKTISGRPDGQPVVERKQNL